jgi:hypothetical protein
VRDAQAEARALARVLFAMSKKIALANARASAWRDVLKYRALECAAEILQET